MAGVVKKTKSFIFGCRRHFSAKHEYDVIVIGGGPGGYVCSIRCGQQKLKVLNVNEDKHLGGTCLNRGCIPSKSLLHISHHFYEATHRFKDYGILTNDVKVDVQAVHKKKQHCMNNLAAGISFLFKKNNVEHISGHGSLIDEHTVLVKTDKEEKKVTAEKIVLATGSKPIEVNLKKIDDNDVNNIDNINEFLPYDHKMIQTSDDILNFSKIPKRLAIIGAGVIGLELGSVFSRFGSEVTLFEYGDRLCGFLDADVSKVLQKTFEKKKLQFLFNSGVIGGNVKNEEATLFYKNNKTNEIKKLQTDMVLVCVGRRGNFDNLNLKALNINLNKNKKLDVDEHFNIQEFDSIKAIGDIVDGPMLAHKAEEEGYVVANIIYSELKKNKKKKNHIDYNLIPSVIYTHPEIASVGMNEVTCKKLNKKFKSVTFPFAANSRARTIDDYDGLIKLLVETDTNIILGSQIVGNNASDLILPLSIYVSNNGTAKSLSKIIYAHPTFSEVIKEVSLQAYDKAIHM